VTPLSSKLLFLLCPFQSSYSSDTPVDNWLLSFGSGMGCIIQGSTHGISGSSDHRHSCGGRFDGRHNIAFLGGLPTICAILWPATMEWVRFVWLVYSMGTNLSRSFTAHTTSFVQILFSFPCLWWQHCSYLEFWFVSFGCIPFQSSYSCDTPVDNCLLSSGSGMGCIIVETFV
jgi:hypothetical protein